MNYTKLIAIISTIIAIGLLILLGFFAFNYFTAKAYSVGVNQGALQGISSFISGNPIPILNPQTNQTEQITLYDVCVAKYGGQNERPTN